MAIQTLSQRLVFAYPISKTIEPQNLGSTDFRNYCNNVSEFESLYNALGVDPRYDGLVTYEIENGCLKTCKKVATTWVWEELPTMTSIVTKIEEKIAEGNFEVDLTGYYTKEETDAELELLEGIVMQRVENELIKSVILRGGTF